MNIQTEQLENHTTRLVVQVDAERLNAAKKKAAQNLSKKVNIPGFRKGKAPYNVVMRYFGEASIIEDAVEIVADAIYPQALKESEIQAYGQGSLEKIDLEPELTLTFTVAMQPTATLNDYRSARLDYEVPEVNDDTLERAMKSLQEQNGVVEESSEPAASGNRLTMDIHSVYIDTPAEIPVSDDQPEAEAEEAELRAEDAAEAEDPMHDVDVDDVFLHEHGAQIMLDDEYEPAPGFYAAVMGMVAGDVREFDLDIPDDEKYGDAAGRKAHFSVSVSKIENVALPALDDEFAARLTADEETPLNLEELRVEMRNDLEEAATQRYDSDYQVRALDLMRQTAQLSYPEAMVHDEIHGLLEKLDSNLRQQKMTLDVYKTIYRKTDEDLHEDYRPLAIRNVERSLTMRELMAAEKIRLSIADLQAEIERVAAPFPEEQRDQIRALFNNSKTLDSLANDVIRKKVLERVAAIARGQNPEIEPEPAPADTLYVPDDEVVTEGEGQADVVVNATADAEPVQEDAAAPEAQDTPDESASQPSE